MGLTETEVRPPLAAAPEPEPEPEEEPAAAAPPEAEEEPAAEEKPTPPMQIALPGDWTAISGEFGGDDPQTSEIRLLGGRMPIEGSFPKGAEFDIVCRVKVTGVLGQDTVDGWGETKSTIRRHMARLISVRRA